MNLIPNSSRGPCNSARRLTRIFRCRWRRRLPHRNVHFEERRCCARIDFGPDIMKTILAPGLLLLLGFGVAGSIAAGPSNAEGWMLYVSNERSGDVSVIDGPTSEVLMTISVGKRPRGIHCSPDGQFVYVALSG